MRIRFLFSAALLAAAAAGDLHAQNTAAPGAVTVSASLRTRAEAWRWFESSADDEYTYSGSILRAGLAQQRERLGWQLELAAPILLGLPDDASAPAPQGQAGVGASYYAANGGETNTASIFLKQANVRFGSVPGTAGHGVRIGRFEFADGTEMAAANPTLAALKRDRIAHRIIGTFGWSHAGRSLDGLQYGYTRPGLNLTAVAARPTQGVFSVDGWPQLDIGVAYAAVTLPQTGGDHPGEGRLFAAYYVDYRDGLTSVDNRPAVREPDEENISITTLGGHYLRELNTTGGAIDVLLWGAIQTGKWGLQDHRAWAGAVEVGIQPELTSLRPWLRAGWSAGSGDGDPIDDDHGTFFQLLPTPRIYARVPFYNSMNSRDAFASLILRPSSRVNLRADVHRLRLSSAWDRWYAGGGAFENDSFGFGGRPSGGSTDLALLADIGVDVRLHQRLTSALYFGWVDGGEVVEAIYPDGPSARLAYIEFEYRR